MVQSNVIVTYAPARRAAEPVRRPRGNQPRWGVTLAGALLAGGAVFAIGQFVRPDGSLRQTSLPASTPMAGAGRIAIPPASGPIAEAEMRTGEPAPLPYLAFVSEHPPPPETAKRELSAHSPRKRAAVPQQASLQATIDPAPASRDPPVEPELTASPPAPAPVAGQRRDLEGFLSEQGLALATPSPKVSGEVPVTEWTEEELAPPESPEPASSSALAGSAAVAPAPGSKSVLELTESDTLPASAAPAEIAGKAPIETIADLETESLAAAQPLAEPMPAASGARTLSPAEPAALGKAAPLPPPMTASAKPVMTEAPVAAYVQLFPTAVVNGQALGAVTMRDLGAQGMAVHLGALVGLLKLRMPQAEFDRLSTAAAADQFVTLDQLRAAGISAQYDARAGRLLIDAR